MISLVILRRPGYRERVTAKSVTGFGDPTTRRRTSAQITTASAFFVPAVPCYGGCAWETERSAGVPFGPVRQPAHSCLPSFGDVGGSSNYQTELHLMIPTRNPSAIRARAAAHRQMAMSALHADSSLSTRLRRYNAHMAIARDLEAQGVTHGQH